MTDDLRTYSDPGDADETIVAAFANEATPSVPADLEARTAAKVATVRKGHRSRTQLTVVAATLTTIAAVVAGVLIFQSGPDERTVRLVPAESTSTTSSLRSTNTLPAQPTALTPVVGLSGATQIVGTDYGACALLSDGTVKCWGRYLGDVVANGIPLDSAVPVAIGGVADAQQLSVAGWGTCALVAGGKVKCWDPGNRTTSSTSGTIAQDADPIRAVDIDGIEDATEISGKCALLEDRTVSCWDSGVAQKISGVTDVTEISQWRQNDEYFTCALLGSGKIKCWGIITFGLADDTVVREDPSVPIDVPDITTAVHVVVGPYTACAILSGGTVTCWGEPTFFGLTGPGETLTRPTAIAGITDAMKISVSSVNACAVLSDQTIKCWGQNANGQLGDGRTTAPERPVPVLDMTGATVVAVDGGTACGLRQDGTIACWGHGGFGVLGDDSRSISPSPRRVEQVTNAVDFTFVGSSVCALLQDGGVTCWGRNDHGQLGTGAFASPNQSLPGDGFRDVAYVTRQDLPGREPPYRTCAVTTDGSVECNGYFDWVPGSVNPNASEELPFRFRGIAHATQVVLGDDTLCALIKDGTVSCFGSNISGQLGDGTTNTPDAPKAVKGISNATQISLENYRVCARLADGTVWCWGGRVPRPTRSDAYSQVPADAASDVGSLEPVQVQGISDAVEVTTSEGINPATCALLQNGSIKCWGDNSSGQLGNGSTEYSATPVEVRGITNAIHIASGSASMCAVLEGGTVKCWGANGLGQLGDGTTTNSPTPVDVQGLTNAVAVSESCALLADGTVKCWGMTAKAKDGQTVFVTKPVQIVGIRNATQIDGTAARLADGTVRYWQADQITLGAQDE